MELNIHRTMEVCNFCAKQRKQLKKIIEIATMAGHKTIVIKDLLNIFSSDLLKLLPRDISCSICGGCLQQLENCYTFVQQTEKSALKLKQDLSERMQDIVKKKKIDSEIHAAKEKPHKPTDAIEVKKDDKCSNKASTTPRFILPKPNDNPETTSKLMRSSHSESRLYKCLECTKAFKSFKHLREHETVCCSNSSVEGIFVCKYCHLCFQEEKALKKHEQQLHVHQQFVCCLCNDRSFSSKGYLTRHIAKVHEHKCLKYFCGECQDLIVLNNPEIVCLHFKENHSVEINKGNATAVSSDDDDVDLEMHEEFLDEFLLAHTNENSFQFSECWEALDLHLPDMLHNHASSNHNSEEFSEAFPCPKCFEQFKSVQPLLKHLAQQHNMPVLICRTCRKSFSTFSEFKHHKLEKCVNRASSETSTIPCPYCKKTFKTSLSLNQHLRIVHTQHKKHICQLCDKQFSTLDHLKKHVLSQHQNERKHICSICSKAFTQLCHLKQHLSIHTTGKTLQCPNCEEKFWRKIDMLRHVERKHEGPQGSHQ